MSYFYINTNMGSVRAKWLASDDSWIDAAERAIKRKFGRGASAYRWVESGRAVDRDRRTVATFYRATVVGRKRHGSYPVIAEANTSISEEK